MAEKTKSINLLPNKGEGFLNQFLRWALSIGRLLIILTETLALGTFLYRFSLDMKITDLHDSIKNQSAIVEQFKTTEAAARNLQLRLFLAKKQEALADNTTDIFADITEMGRGKVTFRDLLVTRDTAKIDVQSGSNSSLNIFVNSLKEYPLITSINIAGVENKTSASVIRMSITANLKNSAVDEEKTPANTPIEGIVSDPNL